MMVDRLIMPRVVGISNRGIIDVPDLVEMHFEEARQQLYDIGLRLQVNGHEYSDSHLKGSILSQQPPAGEKVKKGRHVCVIVSDGPEVGQIPKVSNFTEAAARRALREEGFRNVSSRTVYDEKYPQNLVVETEPPGGARTSREMPVVLKISNGPRPTHADMPNVIGEMLSDAQSQILDQGLVVGRIEYRSSPSSREGSVVSQSVPPGTHVPFESSVDLVVSGSR
jgi:serine/threonine-protein kinase